MIIQTVLLTNDSLKFVPRSIFEKEDQEHIWMEVNYKATPPIKFKELVDTDGDHLGINHMPINMIIDPVGSILNQYDRLILKGYEFYITEIL